MKSSGSSIGITTILTLIFVILKLTGNIDWSWWWVVSPIWIGWGFMLVIILIFVVVEYLFRNT